MSYLYSLYDTVQIRSGQVGIGTTAPRADFDVEGTARTTSNLTDYLGTATPGNSIINVLGKTLSNIENLYANNFQVGALDSSDIVVNSINTYNASSNINVLGKSLSNVLQVSLSNLVSPTGIVSLSGNALADVTNITLSNVTGTNSIVEFSAGTTLSNVATASVAKITSDNAFIDFTYKTLSNIETASLSNITSATGLVHFSGTSLVGINSASLTTVTSTNPSINFSYKSLSNIETVTLSNIKGTNGIVDLSTNTLSNVGTASVARITSDNAFIDFTYKTLSNIQTASLSNITSDRSYISFSGKDINTIRTVTLSNIVGTNGIVNLSTNTLSNVSVASVGSITSDNSSISFTNKGLTDINSLMVTTNATIGGTITASNIQVIGDFTTLNTTTSNTEQMFINNAGSGPALQVIQTGTAAVAAFYDGDTVSGTPALFIADGANIGFGTSAPSSILHAYDSVGSVYATLETDAAAAAAQVLLLNSNVNARVGVAGDNTLTLATDGAFPLTLKTNNTERVRVLANGNVGVGSTAPAYPVDISGRTRISDVMVQTIGSMNIFRYANGGVAYTNGNGKNLGVNLTWANTVTDDTLGFRVSFKMHLATSTGTISFRMFEALITPNNNGVDKPVMVVDGDNNSTNAPGFNSFSNSGARAAGNSVDLKVTWNSTASSYKGYVQIEVFAPTALGNFTFTNITA